MRFLISLSCALALAATGWPAAAVAQTGEPEKSMLERWHPEAFVEPEKPKVRYATEPVLRLELDSAGFSMTPYESLDFAKAVRAEQEEQMRRKRLGIGITVAVVVAVGIAVGASVAAISNSFDDW